MKKTGTDRTGSKKTADYRAEAKKTGTGSAGQKKAVAGGAGPEKAEAAGTERKKARAAGTEQKKAGAHGTEIKKAGASQEKKAGSRCPVSSRCGGCTMIDVPYADQLAGKQEAVCGLIGKFGPVEQIIRMKNPDHYRGKVTSVFGQDRRGKTVCGIYRKGTHEVVPVKKCLLEDTRADRIIQTISQMLPSYRISGYNEDTGSGLLRYVQIRAARAGRQVMVTLVTSGPLFPHAAAFVRELTEKHPEIACVVQNINDRDTTMVLGPREKVLYGPGYIEDVLCGKTFRISSRSFYQVNSLQTEKLYNIAIDMAGLSGKERILDAYCGIGTIGVIAADRCREVLCVELNPEAVKDAVINARNAGAANVTVYSDDAGKFIDALAQEGQKIDVVFMDPPRSGASEQFLESLTQLGPARVVYISCEPTTLARDLEYLTQHGYMMKKAVPVDMFPYTPGIEAVTLLVRPG